MFFYNFFIFDKHICPHATVFGSAPRHPSLKYAPYCSQNCPFRLRPDAKTSAPAPPPRPRPRPVPGQCSGDIGVSFEIE